MGDVLGAGGDGLVDERPRVLLAAAVAMVPAFLVIVLPGARLWAWHDGPMPGAGVDGGGAVAAGGVRGGDLLGEPVLRDGVSGGSAEHGGYHESLINFGSAVGPIAGCARRSPGRGTCRGVGRRGDGGDRAVGGGDVRDGGGGGAKTGLAGDGRLCPNMEASTKDGGKASLCELNRSHVSASWSRWRFWD